MAVQASQGLPYIGSYLQDQRGYQLAYEQAKAGLEAKRQNILNQYGFMAAHNPQGAITGYEVDPGNQTGLYQQMRAGEAYNLEDAMNASYGRGFTGGLARQPLRRIRFAQAAQEGNFMRDLLGQLGDVNTGLLGNQADYQQNRLGTLQAAIQSAIDNRQFTPAVLDALTKGAGGSVPQEAMPRGVFAGNHFFETRKELARFLARKHPKKYGNLTNKAILRKFAKRHPKKHVFRNLG